MTGFEPTPQGFADLHTDRYTTLSCYLVEILGFEPSAVKGTDLQSAAVTYAARPPNL